MTVTAPLALLTIPGLNVSTVVFHGTDTHTLRVGVGHVEHTAWPGEAGNVAIAGHRDSFFRPLRNIKRGDDILLETPRGTLRYRVTLFAVVQSNDMSVLAPTREDTLTLVTCFPFSFIGTAPDRFIVKAVRVSP
jgi:sortase A